MDDELRAAAKRMTFALDLRAGDVGDIEAAERVERRHGASVAHAYYDLCKALATATPGPAEGE